MPEHDRETAQRQTPEPDTGLAEFILDALTQFPLGLSEYDLIKYIQAAGHIQFRNIALWDKLSLFHTHFILFHTLYKLRDQLWQTEQRVLDICPLKIILYASHDEAPSDSHAISEHDPLRDYYLDLSNLAQTTEDDVAELLTSFWVRLSANDQRNEALRILELQDPVDHATIKKQYRRLAMRYHPDRGGDKVKLQTLNYAMSVLDKCKSR